MISDSELGNIVFVRSERAKHIHVRILSNGLRVSLPHRKTREDAMDFIHSVRAKILRKQALIQKKEESQNILINKDSELHTLTFDVNIKPVHRADIHFALKDKKLTIEFPQTADCSSQQMQQYFWNGIDYFLRKDAKRILPERTKQLADKYGFMFTDVKIQSSKSRWGSCSRAKSINLSFYLLLLPTHLIDYVILHELCHTKEMNHGANFWIWMDRVTSDKSTELRKELKKYNMPKN
jgi:predicted metal-dependent hydrolase